MKLLIIITFIIIFSGCASLNSINNKEKLLDGNIVLAVDAKQRFAVSKKLVNSDGTSTEAVVTCLEPSPDVMAAISSALTGSFNKGDAIEAIVKATVSESTATIGIRTEAIQLLRDAMYRLCEGYINGAISSAKYEDMHAKYQKSMVTLAAIGTLADSARPVQMALTGNTSITRSELINKLLDDIKEVELAIKNAKSREQIAGENYTKHIDNPMCKLNVTKDANKLATGVGAVTDEELCQNITVDKKDIVETFCKIDDDKVKDQCKDLNILAEEKSTVKRALTSLEENKKRINDDLQVAKTNDNLLATTTVSWSQQRASQPNTQNIQEVANVVKQLVTQVYADGLIGRCMEMSIVAIKTNSEITNDEKGLNKSINSMVQFLNTRVQLKYSTDFETYSLDEVITNVPRQDISKFKKEYEIYERTTQRIAKNKANVKSIINYWEKFGCEKLYGSLIVSN